MAERVRMIMNDIGMLIVIVVLAAICTWVAFDAFRFSNKLKR